MPVPVIQVSNLSKRYRLGGLRSLDQTFREMIYERARRRLGGGTRKDEQSPSREFWALRDVSFDVDEGEVLGIIGPNGAGKSTLLKILSRITDPTEGTVINRGRVASLLEVGTGFHPELTGRENIYLNGAILGMRKREISAKFDEIVDFSGIEKFLDTPVKRYSSGMSVRLAFAVAAHLQPEILLVDEVLAVGDAQFQKKCLGKMKNVASSGRTVLFVSHNMGVIDSLCNRAILIDGGRIGHMGDTQSTIRTYLETVVGERVSTPLADRTDRTGDGTIRLTGFDIEDPRGTKIANIRSGDDVTFVLSFACGDGQRVPLKNVKAGLGFCTSLSQRLCILYTDYVGQNFDTVPTHGEIRCRINNFPFAPGQYEVHIRLVANGRDADWLRTPAAYIDVVEGDFYGTGVTVDPQAPLLIHGDWSVESAMNHRKAA